MAEITIRVELQDRIMERIEAAVRLNEGNRWGNLDLFLVDALHAGIQDLLHQDFRTIWEGFGPDRETIYERNVDAADNDPGYAFYDTPKGRVHLTRAEMLPLLNKLRG